MYIHVHVCSCSVDSPPTRGWCHTRAKACCLQEVDNVCLYELYLPNFRQTVIHFCAAQNFVEFLQDLAELGASIDLADNKGTCIYSGNRK